MNLCIKTAALALAMTTVGANAALAGKTTTPNPSAPPVVVVTASQTLTGITASVVDSDLQSAYIRALLNALQLN